MSWVNMDGFCFLGGIRDTVDCEIIDNAPHN